MAFTTTQTTAEFSKSLGRLYGLYTGGFLAFIIFIAVIEQLGVPNRILGYLFVFAWQQDRIDRQHGVAEDD